MEVPAQSEDNSSKGAVWFFFDEVTGGLTSKEIPNGFEKSGFVFVWICQLAEKRMDSVN
jgi:hypothetical protein